MEMKQEGTAFNIQKHVHNYPHCWRTDKPILYYPLDSWFIKDTAKKERMVELNKTIRWQPESTGTGRFGNWLENLNDWNLSRSRFWVNSICLSGVMKTVARSVLVLLRNFTTRLRSLLLQVSWRRIH